MNTKHQKPEKPSFRHLKKIGITCPQCGLHQKIAMKHAARAMERTRVRLDAEEGAWIAVEEVHRVIAGVSKSLNEIARSHGFASEVFVETARIDLFSADIVFVCATWKAKA